MNAILKPEDPRIGIFPNEPASEYYVRRLDIAAIEDEAVQANVQDEYDVAVERLA